MELHSEKKKIYALDNDRIDYYWKDIEKLLESVPMLYEFYSPEWLYEHAKMGRLQLWALSDSKIKGIVVTQICTFPKASALQILACAGIEMLKFIDEQEGMFDWVARQNGCSFVQAICRPGLARKLKTRGITTGVILTRAVHSERIQ